MTKPRDSRRALVEKDAEGQYARGDHGRKNDGVTNAKPRVLPNEPSRNAEADPTDGQNRT